MSAEDSAAFCADLVRRADPERFLAGLFAPEAARRPLYALHAFDIEVSRIPALVRQPLAGEIRLQWWREAIAGERGEEAAGHPVMTELRQAIAVGRLPAHAFDNLLSARLRDLYDDPVATVEELEGYCGDTAAAMLRLATLVLAGGTDPGGAEAAGHGGVALGIARLLGEIGQGKGGQLAPAEVLGRHGASRDDLVAGNLTPALAAALAELRALAQRHLGEARRHWPTLAPAIRPAFLPLAALPLRLRRLERRPFGGGEPALWRRQAALWLAARRARL
ncbi:MAG TPA: squalene/phytoene synthase family protein [Hyphomicrobiales bacterium]|nr:squalene/phytoene synthase family protein [Hyphomicrobiales bacterium]